MSEHPWQCEGSAALVQAEGHRGCHCRRPSVMLKPAGRHLNVDGPDLVREALPGRSLLLSTRLGPRVQRAQHTVHGGRSAEVPRHRLAERRPVEVSGVDRVVLIGPGGVPCFQAPKEVFDRVPLSQEHGNAVSAGARACSACYMPCGYCTSAAASDQWQAEVRHTALP